MALDLISVDDHIIEHGRVWTDRLASKWHEVCPHVVEADGREYWVYETNRSETMGLNAVAGRKREDYSTDPVRFGDMIPGCYDPKARVADMDRDGVRASLGFPSFPRFCGQTFLMAGTDRELGALCVQAWNDFVLDEWCATAPQRFIPMIIGPLWDPDGMAAEVRRCSAKGARAISFCENPSKLGLPSLHTDHWDALWRGVRGDADGRRAAHRDVGQPPAHLTGCADPRRHRARRDARAGVVHRHHDERDPAQVPRAAASRSPRVASGGCPYALERADYTWERHRFWSGLGDDRRPSDVFRNSIWVCFIDDEAGLEQRHRIGVDKIMWECDYPHSDSTWPDSQKRAGEVLAGLPDDEVAAITHGNAEALFRWPPAPSRQA